MPLNALPHDAHAFITVTWLIALLITQLLKPLHCDSVDMQKCVQQVAS